MDKFDEKVIGYESTKDILRQILDILKRPEVYKRKGISIPRGLLMESDPGLGKSLLASILMEESERKPFVFRKTSQENSFLGELRQRSNGSSAMSCSTITTRLMQPLTRTICGWWHRPSAISRCWKSNIKS